MYPLQCLQCSFRSLHDNLYAFYLCPWQVHVLFMSTQTVAWILETDIQAHWTDISPERNTQPMILSQEDACNGLWILFILSYTHAGSMSL